MESCRKCPGIASCAAVDQIRSRSKSIFMSKRFAASSSDCGGVIEIEPICFFGKKARRIHGCARGDRLQKPGRFRYVDFSQPLGHGNDIVFHNKLAKIGNAIAIVIDEGCSARRDASAGLRAKGRAALRAMDEATPPRPSRRPIRLQRNPRRRRRCMAGVARSCSIRSYASLPMA